MRGRCLRAAAAVGAAALVSAAHSRLAGCIDHSTRHPPPAVLDARERVKAQLERGHVGVPAEEAMRQLKLALKGGRICARITLADESLLLAALLPIIREFPSVSWQAENASSIIGETIVLHRPATDKASGGSLSILMPNHGISDRMDASAVSELELFGGSSFSDSEARALANSLAVVHKMRMLKQQHSRVSRDHHLQHRSSPGLTDAFDDFFGRRTARPQAADPIERLQALGVSVDLGTHHSKRDGWDALAGGEKVQAALEESLLLPMQRPEVYKEVIQGTRAKDCTPHAKSILFEGPPGTGKTSTARILAAKLGRPLVYLPLESVVSKWYGEAEQRLAAVFDACAEMGSTVIFLDEIDALATSRDDAGMHEASRRSLSVLLRKLDGFEANESTVLIAATNRPQDLDAALLSRFELTIPFPLPEEAARKGIFALYAKHLKQPDLERLASLSVGSSGRDIRDVCEAAERRWGAKRVRDEAETAGVPLPPVEEYIKCLQERKAAQESHVKRRWR